MADDEDINPFVRRGVPAQLLLCAVPVVYLLASGLATAAAPSDGSNVYPLAVIATSVVGAVLGVPIRGHRVRRAVEGCAPGVELRARASRGRCARRPCPRRSSPTS